MNTLTSAPPPSGGAADPLTSPAPDSPRRIADLSRLASRITAAVREAGSSLWSWISDGSEFSLCDRAEVEEMARIRVLGRLRVARDEYRAATRDAAFAGNLWRAHAATIPDEPGQSVDLRRGRTVVCGDHGVSVSVFDRCQWCNGFATSLHRGER